MLSPSLFLPYLLIALVVTAVAARRARTPSRKRWVTIGLLAFFIAFAYIDDILGGIEHRWLCHKEAGFWVYKQAKLPPELYDAAGKPKFMTDRGPDEKMLAPYIRYEWRTVSEYSKTFLKIDQVSYHVVDLRNGEVIAKNTTFHAWPSDFIPAFSHVAAVACFVGNEQATLWRRWDLQVYGLQ